MENKLGIKCIVVDDQKRFRAYLVDILQMYFPEVKVLTQAGNVAQAANAIRKYQPDLVFLDVELGHQTGFDLLTSFAEDQSLPLIVFITGHSNYAIPAIKANAFDYLLKPIDLQELKKTMKEVTQKLEELLLHQQLMGLLASNSTRGMKLNIPVIDGTEFVDMENIIMFRAARNYTEIVLKNSQQLLASKTLKWFEEKVPAKYFFRSHRSFLINIFEIKAYRSVDGGHLIMKGDIFANLSASRKELLFHHLDQISPKNL